MKNVNEIIKNLNKLKPMPVVVSKLSMLVSNADSAIDEIIKVISYDPALAANVLRWANSALWAKSSTIVMVKDAVIRLGAGRILQIIVGKQVRPSLEKSMPEYGLDSGELWRHAIASGLAAEELNLYTSVDLPSETFTAAILHDIGKIILKQLIDPEKLESIIRLSNSDGMTYIEAEQKVLGYSHCDAGYEMAKQWNFSDNIAQSILYHHKPDENQNTITDAVHVSNIVAKMIGVGLGNEALNLSGSFNAAVRLGLTVKSIEKMCFSVNEKLPELEKLYEL